MKIAVPMFMNDYASPLGRIFLTADGNALTGLWFEGQKIHVPADTVQKETPVIADTKKWLDIYFSGRPADFSVPLRFSGTPFQNEVWRILCSVPFGTTVTYGEIARQLAEKRDIRRMSAQAAGGAVGRNKIAILIPCHRVIGADGSLTGYAGGLHRKLALLKLEGSSSAIRK